MTVPPAAFIPLRGYYNALVLGLVLVEARLVGEEASIAGREVMR